MNPFNVAGAVTSAALIVFSYILPVRSLFSKIFKLGISQNVGATHCEPTTSSLRRSRKKTVPLEQPSCVPQLEELTPQETLCEEKEQTVWEPEIVVAPELASKSNGCPKNLAYYAMKPRPKSAPAECMGCEKLLECVCQTSS